MNINYLILAHKNPNQMIRLVKKLNNENVNFYIHIDKDAIIEAFKAPLISFKNVKFIPNNDRVTSIWGDISLVKATIKY